MAKKSKPHFPSDDYLLRNTADNFSALYPRALEARMGELNNYANFIRSNQSPYVTRSFESMANAAPIKAQAVELSPIQQMLQTQALSELAQGSQLAPEDQRAASQAANAAYAARGMAMGNSSAAAEILHRYQLGQQRLQQRRQFGQSVDQQDLQRRQFNNDLQLRADQSNQNFLVNRAGLTLQQDPARTALQGPTVVMPTLGMSADMANTTYNAAMARYNSAQNYAAAQRGAQMQAGSMRRASNNTMIGAGIASTGAVVGGLALVAF